jgi:hypothetical protein
MSPFSWVKEPHVRRRDKRRTTLISTPVTVIGNVACMERDPETGRWLITPIQRVIAILFAVVLVALVVVVARVPPRKEAIGELRYPQTSGSPIYFVYQPTPAPVESVISLLPDSFTNVTKFYHGRFGVPMNSGNSFFSWRRSGLLGLRRRYSQQGFVASRDPEALNDTFAQRNDTQSIMVHVCGQSGSTNTTAWIVSVPSHKSVVVPALPAVARAMQHPSSRPSTGGTTQHVTIYSDVVTNSLTNVTDYYIRNFGTNSAPGSARQQVLTLLGETNQRGTFVQLASARMPGWPIPTNEVAFVFITSKTVSLIHAVSLGAKTRVTVAVAAK